MIKMITRVRIVVRDTTSITAIVTETPTVGSLAGAPEPEEFILKMLHESGITNFCLASCTKGYLKR